MIKMLYLHFCKTYKHQIWRSDDLGEGLPLTKSLGPLIKRSPDVMWQNKNVISVLSLVGWQLRVRGFHTPSRMSLWSCDNVLSGGETTYFHFCRIYKHQNCHNGDFWWGTLTHKAIWSLIMSSDNVMWQIGNASFPLPQDL